MKRGSWLVVVCLWWAMSSYAASLTATVTAYNKVELSGDGAEQVESDYIQYQTNHFKCRLLKDERAVLQLSGLPAGNITSATLRMHSNKTAGSGRMQLMVDGVDVWTIAPAVFSSPDWNGAFSSDYVDIVHSFRTPVPMGDVYLEIAALANSLYFESITITYDAASPEPHTVSFVTPDMSIPAISETEAGGGVMLPDYADPHCHPEWFFIGWTDMFVAQQEEMPTVLRVGERYHPVADVTLYPLYTTLPPQTVRTEQDTTFQSGEYAFVTMMWESDIAYGPVGNKQLRLDSTSVEWDNVAGVYVLEANFVEDAYRYWFEFVGDSVYITHLATETPVGYLESGGVYQLSDVDSPWGWDVAERNTLFFSHDYTPADGYCQALVPSVSTSKPYLRDARQKKRTDWTHFALFPVGDLRTSANQVWYSSTPRYAAVENIAAATIDWTQPVAVYTIDGRYVVSLVGTREQLMATLPCGIYLLKQGTLIEKVKK